MSKSKSPSLPPTPQFTQNPVASSVPGQLQQLGLNAVNFNGLPAPLMEALSTSPELTALTLQGLQAQLEPQLRQSRQDLVNTLEANNQLTGSTTGSALGNIQSDYEAQLVAAGAEAGINDINRAFQNRMSLYGTGLNTLQAAGQLGLESQSQQNQFSLANYENQVSAIMANQKNRGGFAGAITGGLGGALGGSIFGPVGAVAGGLLGGAAGYYGPSGTGSALSGGGAGLYGMNLMGQQPSIFGSNNPAQTNRISASPIYSGEQINNTLAYDPFRGLGLIGGLR